MALHSDTSWDQTDGYSGVPGIGIKRAVALFEEHGYTWDTVVKAFADKDLDEDVALMNARLAKILTNKEYDGQVIPGAPPMPVTEMTMEQSFKLRRLEDLLPEADKADIITLFMALQRQNYALTNTVSNLLKHWPNHPNTTPADPIEVWDFIRDQQLNYHLGNAIKYICRSWFQIF